MQKQQIPIAAWMRTVVADRGITPSSWAKAAKLGRNTVSRAMRDDYPHVTSTTTLLKLAAAARTRPPLQSESFAGLPSEELLALTLSAILAVAVPDRVLSDDLVKSLAGALRDTLALLASDEGVASDPIQSRLVARTTAQLQFGLDASV
jgi:hypothetical protein